MLNGYDNIDLLFVEYAVNDDQDANHVQRECIRGLEGIVRHTRAHNPRADIVVTHFLNERMLKLLQDKKTPLSIASHEAVTTHYNVPTIHLAAEVARQITAGNLTWKIYGGTHPKPFGNAIGAGMIDDLFGRAWTDSLVENAKPKNHALPAALDADNYQAGRFLPVKSLQLDDRWKDATPPWRELKGHCRDLFRNMKLVYADTPGSRLTFSFKGRAVGAFLLAGPDAGTVVTRIDGGPPKKTNLYHHHSRGLHYPRTQIFHADLGPGEHQFELVISNEKDSRSQGHAVRVLHFVAN